MKGTNKFDQLEDKIKSLVDKFVSLKEDLTIVKQENTDLRRQLEAFQKERIQQDAGTETVATKTTEEKQEFRAELDRYINEIDECIDLVSNL